MALSMFNVLKKLFIENHLNVSVKGGFKMNMFCLIQPDLG